MRILGRIATWSYIGKDRRKRRGPVEQERRKTFEVDADSYMAYHRHLESMRDVFPHGIPSPGEDNNRGSGKIWRDTVPKVMAVVIGIILTALIAFGKQMPSESDQAEWTKTSREFREFRAEKTAQLGEISRGIERLERSLRDLKRSIDRKDHGQ
jgi:hypothetical protein